MPGDRRSEATPPPRVLLRGEDSDGRVGMVETVMPAGAKGPPLHVHDFDEAFYVLEGELTFQLGEELITVGPREVAFAVGGVPHALANRGDRPARSLIVFTPAGFEREFARRAADRTGGPPPDWALQPIPPVTRVGPRIGERP